MAAALAAFGPGPSWSAFPGENGRLAFESNRDGNFEIYTMESDGSLPERLTWNSVFDRQPAWSPDGTRIAFSSNRGGRFEIWISNANGSDPRRLTATSTRDNFPAWSPDGARIAFTRSNPVSGMDDIWIVNAADGSGLTRLTPNDWTGEFQPVWSPDGARIAFVTDRDGDLEVYLMGADGSSPVNLTRSPASTESSPDWSPDGLEIVFESDRVDGLGRIFTIGADGSSLLELDGSRSGDGQPVWSPDGAAIAFVGYRDGSADLAVYRIDVGLPESRERIGDPYALGFHDLRPDWQRVPPAPEPENRPPVANAGSDGTLECAPAEGLEVLLDGSLSSDPDSTPGTNDDISSLVWYLDRGLESERVLGTGLTLSTILPPGAHVVTLVVTDKSGLTDSDEAAWTVNPDTTPPSLTLEATPSALWPPDHRMVPVSTSAVGEDTCGPVSIALVTVLSSEPDDARGGGDGFTLEDIQGVEEGSPDFDVLLRAERASQGSGRIYTLVYSAADPAGNVTTRIALVTVSGDPTSSDSARESGDGGGRSRSGLPIAEKTNGRPRREIPPGRP